MAHVGRDADLIQGRGLAASAPVEAPLDGGPPRGRDAAPQSARVAIVGSGWAGLAAAVRLSDAGVACAVFEASRTLGGRARRVPWTTVDGREVALDNGQHILIGAYVRTLALLRHLGVDAEAAFERTPLHLVGANGLRLKASTQKAPWHLVAMILTAKGLGIDERWSIAAFMLRAQRLHWTLADDCTVAALFEAWHQPILLVHKVWEPLCVAALNTPTAIASAQVFLNVLRDSLGGSARDSDLLLPRADLGGLLPDAAIAFLGRRTGAPSTVHAGERIQNLRVDDAGASLASGTATAVGALQRFDAVVLATPPTETARLIAPMALRDVRYRSLVETLEGFAWQPIVTVYLLYREPPTWPARMLALESAPYVDHFGQWAFDRSERLRSAGRANDPAAGMGLVAVVISAEGAHREIDNAVLIAAVARQLATQCGMPSQPLDARIITEKRATYASTPALVRPDGTTPHARLVIAGDYVAEADPTTHYPATLEAAVISGERAADRLLAALRERRQTAWRPTAFARAVG